MTSSGQTAGTTSTTELSAKRQSDVTLCQSEGRSRQGIRIGLVSLFALAVVTMSGWFILDQPSDVPDSNSPTSSNYQGNVDAENWVGQRFVAERDSLKQISVIAATEESNDMSSVSLLLRDGGPEGPVVRTAKVLISDLPEGNPYNYRPGNRDERWTDFVFDPIPESGGHSYYFSLEGKYIPIQNRVRTLMMFHTKFAQGKGYVNGEARDASIVFRSYSNGEVRDYLQVLARNLTAGKPGILASSTTYVVLGITYLLCLGVLLVSSRHMLSTNR